MCSCYRAFVFLRKMTRMYSVCNEHSKMEHIFLSVVMSHTLMKSL